MRASFLKKIIIIDDSRTIRQQVSAALAPSGFEILEAEDGIDALYKITRNPDLALVICDVNMPRMGGLELLEKVAGTGERKSIPIIMLTTEGRADLIEKAKKAGAKGWIVKPFNPKLLLAAVTKVVNTPPQV